MLNIQLPIKLHKSHPHHCGKSPKKTLNNCSSYLKSVRREGHKNKKERGIVGDRDRKRSEKRSTLMTRQEIFLHSFVGFSLKKL